MRQVVFAQMILIDDRTGSKELLPHFKPFDVTAEICHLEYADAAFVGNSAEGQCYVGIERKALGDLVNSIRSKRLSGHQLSGLLDNFEICYLIVEGIWRPGKQGELEVMSGRGWAAMLAGRTVVRYAEVDNFLTSMEEAGLRHRRTSSIQETAFVIVDIYKWRQKEWSEHKAHKDIYAPVPEFQAANGHRLRLHRPTANLVTKIAAQLPGVDQRAWKVGEHFKSPMEMVLADVKEWQKIDGIGLKGAKKIVEVLQR